MIQEVYQQIEMHATKAVEESYPAALMHEIDAFSEVLKELTDLLDTYNTKVRNYDPLDPIIMPFVLDILSLRERVIPILEKHQPKLLPDDLQEDMKEFLAHFESCNQAIPEELVLEQHAERFKPKKDQKFIMRTMIQMKRTIWQISQGPRKLSNVFRKWRKLPLKEERYWPHRIPLHQLVNVHLKDNLAKSLSLHHQELYQLISELLQEIKSITSQLGSSLKVTQPEPPEITTETIENSEKQTENDPGGVVAKTMLKEITLIDTSPFDPLLKEIDFQTSFESMRIRLKEFMNKVKVEAAKSKQEALEVLSEKYQKVGTVELMRRKYSKASVTHRHQQIIKEFEALNELWGNSLKAQIGSWIFQYQIGNLRYFSLKEYLKLEFSFGRTINKNILKELQKLIDYIRDINNRISEFKGDDKELQSMVRMEKVNANKVLNKELTPKTVEYILDQNLPKLLAQAEEALTNKVMELDKDYKVIRTNEYSFPVFGSLLDTANIAYLVKFEYLPKLNEASRKIRTSIFDELNRIQAFVEDINRIVIFTLESAIAVFFQEGKSNQDARLVALDGLKRSIERTNDVYIELGKLFAEVGSNQREKIITFSEEIDQIADLSKLSSFKSKIATARTIERTQRFRKKVTNYIRNVVPFLGFLITTQYKRFRKWLEELQTRLGVGKKVDTISVEIADYLANTENAIAKLPFVYQRLFRLEPLSDSNFYVDRALTIKKINGALDSWSNGNFAPTILVSERGSGSSTILNIFLESQKGKIPSFYHEFNQVPQSEKEFWLILGKVVGSEKIDNQAEFIQYVNSLERGIILTIEEIHHLFLKKVNGFKLLKLLFDLMSLTHKKVFWLCTCSSNSWDYLEKTISISEFYAYTVYIANLSNEEIKETILKRHRVSGYNVEFLQSGKLNNLKKLRRAEDQAQKQQILMGEFFNRLCTFAKSNISLAIIYWLRSTQKVEGNTIYIGVEDLDFSFLSALGDIKLFTIFDILIHDGMTELQLADLRATTIDVARLELINLLDDGILTKIGDYYQINLFLYRPLIRLLSSKNIIH